MLHHNSVTRLSASSEQDILKLCCTRVRDRAIASAAQRALCTYQVSVWINNPRDETNFLYVCARPSTSSHLLCPNFALCSGNLSELECETRPTATYDKVILKARLWKHIHLGSCQFGSNFGQLLRGLKKIRCRHWSMLLAFQVRDLLPKLLNVTQYSCVAQKGQHGLVVTCNTAC